MLVMLSRRADEVLIFDDLERALLAYQTLSFEAHGHVCLGVRLQGGSVVLVTWRSSDGPRAWQKHGTKLPRGGAAMVLESRVIEAHPRIADQAIRRLGVDAIDLLPEVV